MSNVHLSLGEAHALAMKCLLVNGCDDANARAAADRMIQAEGDLCHSHGLFRLPWYTAAVKSGRANGKAKPRVEQLAPAVIRVDGDGGIRAAWSTDWSSTAGRLCTQKRYRLTGLCEHVSYRGDVARG